MCTATELAQKRIWLAEMEAAYRSILKGEQIQMVRGTDGRMVQRNQVSAGSIRTGINELKAEIAACEATLTGTGGGGTAIVIGFGCI